MKKNNFMTNIDESMKNKAIQLYLNKSWMITGETKKDIKEYLDNNLIITAKTEKDILN